MKPETLLAAEGACQAITAVLDAAFLEIPIKRYEIVGRPRDVPQERPRDGSQERQLGDHRRSEQGLDARGAATHSPTVVNWFVRNQARIFRTEFRNPEKHAAACEVSGLSESRSLIDSIGASPADVILADKVLLVEGTNDVPVFKAWLRKAPSYAGVACTLRSARSSIVSENRMAKTRKRSAKRSRLS